MHFFQRTAGSPKRLGVFPGTFNPPTIAHVALARAALAHVEEVVFVLPRVFPHKHYSGASFEQRIELLESVAEDGPFSVAASEGGLFVEIAQECRKAYSAGTQLSFLCGRDAAERIAGWDYGAPGTFSAMLTEFNLLVFSRGGEYQPADELAARVRRLTLDTHLESVSATGIRERIAAGQAWEHLVPAPLHERVRRIYTPAPPTAPDLRSGT